MEKAHEIVITQAYEEPLPYTYAISSYGTDFDVEGLIRRLEREDVFLPPFQRSFVWSIKQASRFVESLLLGLPVPGIFLARDETTQQLLIIDGQQRLYSLLYFYQGIWPQTGKEFALKGLQSRFEGQKYKSLLAADKRRLDNSVLHATIVRQEEPDDGNSSIFFIFERLNTGGISLNPQEIRSALYHGQFNEALEQLNAFSAWRSLYGPTSARRRDIELILRFFALYFDAKNYEKPMALFLNAHMGRNRRLERQPQELLQSVFQETTTLIERTMGSKAFKPKRALNAALFDSVMVGVTRRLERGTITDVGAMRDAFSRLLNNPEYMKAIETATTDEENVQRRLAMATQAFEGIP
jgi:hypothetical protein